MIFKISAEWCFSCINGLSLSAPRSCGGGDRHHRWDYISNNMLHIFRRYNISLWQRLWGLRFGLVFLTRGADILWPLSTSSLQQQWHCRLPAGLYLVILTFRVSQANKSEGSYVSHRLLNRSWIFGPRTGRIFSNLTIWRYRTGHGVCEYPVSFILLFFSFTFSQCIKGINLRVGRRGWMGGPVGFVFVTGVSGCGWDGWIWPGWALRTKLTKSVEEWCVDKSTCQQAFAFGSHEWEQG